MSRTVDAAAAQPRLSFSNWILGGGLVVVPQRDRTSVRRFTSSDADKGLKPKYSFVNEKAYHQNKRVSKDKATNTEKGTDNGNKKKGGGAETAKKPVPKDEIAKKEELNKQAGQSSGWTKAQDEKVLDMKKAGNSWKMIAQEVGASKKDVMNRFKELSKAGETSAENDDPLPFGDMPGMFTEDEPAENSKSAAEPPKNGRGDNGGKGEKGKKDKVMVDAAALEAETGKKVLVPDAIWTIGDLEVLANVEERYRELKWMHVQAGFYNMTGRMVGSEVIKAKFEQG
ncbi:hypothetical protein V494_07752 [Pseudogymnoascus sp. VKM F-4513 (FW-928)]|nr:hypothetical protein V494_07752 [Pseudogymnoascus sp. VKM F-4513 (FW-928)]